MAPPRLQPPPSLLGALVLLLALPVTTAHAQWYGAVRLGALASTFEGAEEDAYDSKLGWGAGMGGGYELRYGLALEAALFYLEKGASTRRHYGTSSVPLDLTWKITYIELPLLAVYRLATRSAITPKLFGGPYVARRFDAVVKIASTTSDLVMHESDPTIHRTDTGIVAGAGIEFGTGTDRISLDLQLHLGRAPLRQDDAGLRNAALSLSAGLIF